MTCRLNSGLHVYLYTHIHPLHPSQTCTHKKNEKKLTLETESRWGCSPRLITQGQPAVGEISWGSITLSILAETHSLTHTHDKTQATDPGSVSSRRENCLSCLLPLFSLYHPQRQLAAHSSLTESGGSRSQNSTVLKRIELHHSLQFEICLCDYFIKVCISHLSRWQVPRGLGPSLICSTSICQINGLPDVSCSWPRIRDVVYLR